MARQKPRPSRFGNLGILPSGRWRARYRDSLYPGKWINAPITFTSKEDGRAWLDDIEHARSKGTWKHPDQIAAEALAAAEEAKRKEAEAAVNNYTAGEWVGEWLQAIEEEDYSANTARSYPSTIKPFLQTFKTTPLRSITSDDLTAWMKTLRTHTFTYVLAEGERTPRTKTKRRSDGTIANLRRVTNICLNAAVEAGRLDKNPMPKLPKRTRESKGVDKPLDYIPTDAEILAARDYALPPIGAAIMLAYKCGLRNGEVRALRRKHFVLDGDMPHVRIRHGMQRSREGGQVQGNGKSEAAIRFIPLDADTVAWLKRYMLEHVGPEDDAIVVSNPVTGNLLADDQLRDGKRRWKDSRDHAGIRSTFRFHDLRAVCLTRLGEDGATLEQLRKFAGHADVKSVMIYQRADQRSLQNLSRPE